MRKKCHNCGLEDRITRDENASLLIGGIGSIDPDDGLLQFQVYCKRCKSLNFYKPKWFGGTKFDRLIRREQIESAMYVKSLRNMFFLTLAPRILNAIVKDYDEFILEDE